MWDVDSQDFKLRSADSIRTKVLRHARQGSSILLHENELTVGKSPVYLPKGSVERSARKALKQEIAAKLDKLEFQGRKVVKEIFFAEDVYSGPHTAGGPDLIVVGEPGCDMKGSVKKKEIFGRSGLQGMHTWDDAFFWASEDLGGDLSIEDVAPVILKNF